jgi:VCBS repeat-containing protein
VTYSLTADTSGGGFKIDPVTGVVTVADATKIDFESAPGHAYTVTAQASDGTLTSSQTFTINVNDVPLSTPVDTNAAANSVAEGAANGTAVGVTALAFDPNGPVTTYSLTGDTSGGGFTINAATGVVTVADGSKIDYESSGAGHGYTITVQANDGLQTTSQTFTIAVSDVAPSTPIDSNAAANTVVEGAANGSTVGVTASSTDVNGPAVTYSLVGDTSGGGFTINAATGVVTVADATKIDYETAAGHAYTVTAQASDGTLTSSQTFTIAVTDVAPSTPVDSNAAANTVAEGAANGFAVGVTASSTDVNGPAVTSSLTGDTSGGGFTINAATGVVTVADATKIDYESAAGHAYTVTAQASDGTLTSSQTFTIAVSDVAPSAPVDSNAAANTVVEGAANGSTVGVTASSTDVNGPAVTYSLTGDTSGGGFTINAATGVVTVADATKIDYETAAGHAYTVTAQASDGTLTSSQTFSIAVTDVAPSTPVDSNAAANTVAEGAANGSTIGVTASSTDVNGPAVTYSLTGDTSGGGFTINAATGVVTVADATKIDYESAPGHAYTITAQASDGTFSSSQTFTIAVTDVAPSTPVDSNAAANTITEGAANGSTVGVTASSTDVNGPAVTYSLTGDTSGGGFTINAATGVVTVADSTKIDFESSGGSYTVVAQSSDGTLTNSQAFVINVTDVAPSTPVDSNAAANQVVVNAAVGSTVGVTAASTDVNGPAVTYSLVGDTSGGGFTINAATGVVTVADPSKILVADPSYGITVDSSDGTRHSQQTFTINVIVDTPPVANDDSVSATEAGGLNNAVAGSNPSGNVILGTGSAGNVQDTDAEDPSSALIVVAAGTGTEAAPTGAGTVNTAFNGLHGSLLIHTDGSYTYTVDQSDAAVQALRTSAQTLTDSFNYTIQDTGGLQDTATLTVTVHGANDTPIAATDTPIAVEAGGLNNGTPGTNPGGNVLTNDTDVDSVANGETKTVQGIATGTQAGPLTLNVGTGVVSANGYGTLTIAADGTYSYVVDNTNAAVQALRTSAQTLTDTFSYTMHDAAGATSTTQVSVTIEGANDNPTANADAANATESGGTANGTPGTNISGFNVLTGVGAGSVADTDPDSAANGETQAVTGVETGNHPGDTVTTGANAPLVGQYGTLTLNTDGSYSYTVDNNNATVDALNTGNHVDDVFTYTMQDAAGAKSTTTLTIHVNGADDAPVAVDQGSAASPAYNAFDAVALNVAAAGVKTGATDVDNSFASLNAGKIADPAHGTVTVNSDGSFTYTAAAGYFGNDSFTYHVTDGVLSSNTATAFISVTPHVAYIDNTASAVGEDGSLAHPFASIADFNTANTIASHFDIIYVEKGTGTYSPTTGITLLAGQTLEGQGVDPSYVRGDNGATVVLHDFDNSAGSIATIVVASGAAVTLNSGNTIQGINITESNSAAAIIDNGSSVGTFNMSGVHITTSGTGLSLTHGGTVTATTAVGTNTITSTTGTALDVENTTIGAGNLTFQSIASGGGSAAGIILNNTGSSGGLHVTGTGTAGSGGTIANKSGADILTGTDAGGQTTSGSAGVGIYLHSTSGVQFTDMQLNDFSNFAIYGNNVTNFSLADSTINGTNGNNNAGDREESSIRFDNLLGTSSIDNSSISGGYTQNVDLYNTSGALNRLTMDSDTFGLVNATGGNDNVLGQVFNSATANYTVTNSNFLGTRSDFIAFLANNNTSMDAVVRGNTFHNGQAIVPGGGTAVDIRSGSGGLVSAATTTFDISHNILTDGGANAFDTVGIFVAKGQDNGTMSGTIASNAIGPAKVNSNSDGIFVREAGTGTLTTLIQNNTITGVGDAGIALQNNDGSATMNATLYGNTVSSPTSGFPFAALDVENGATGTDTSTTNIVVGSSNAGAGSKNTLTHNATYATDVELSNFNSNTHLNLSKNGSTSGTAQGVITDDNNGAPLVDTTGGSGTTALVTTVPTLPAVVAPLLAASGGVAASTPTPGEMHLSQAELDSVVAAAIAQWAAAGASASQLAALHATTFSIADLSGAIVGQETAPAHVTIDTDAAGHGWFVDPTPSDNFEFTHALNATGTDLLTDPSNAAAGHLDLLTTVTHELGHVLGLDDSTLASDVNDLMYISLVDGERRLPDAADVAQANSTLSSAAATSSAAPAAGQTFDAGQGGHTLVGTAGPDSFVFANVAVHAPTPPPVTLIENYSFAQGDKFDFSAITSQFHASGLGDALIVRAVEDAGGKFATLQVDTLDPHGLPGQPTWVNVAQIDGAHAGDAVNVLIDGATVHMAQIHVGLLA